MVKKRIFPLTRIHEPMKVEVEVNNGMVTDAWISSTLFRGFELMLTSRDPRDVSLYTQRICGICSTAHAMASTLALEEAYGLEPPPNGVLIRNLITGSDFIQNHIRHFYILALPDYARGPATPPFRPLLPGDYKIPEKVEEELYRSYWLGAEMSAKAHQMLALWGAKAPHQQTILPGGVTQSPDAQRINAFLSLLTEIDQFVTNHYLPDVQTVAHYYPEYYQLGKGFGNLLTYGMLPRDNRGGLYFQSGLILEESTEIKDFNPQHITEQIHNSWYRGPGEAHPFQGETDPDLNNNQGYSWVKSARYQGAPFETGPLARLWINGHYQRGISTMDRLMARALETKEIIKLMYTWVDRIALDGPTLHRMEPQTSGQGAGLMDTMRGSLGHWLKITNGRIGHYQVVTPSTWNFASRDKNNLRGPAEEALVSTPIENVDSLIEVGRIIRSFDPCFSCSVHLVQGNKSLEKYIF